MRPFAGPPLLRLVQRDALRRAAACERAAFCAARGDRVFCPRLGEGSAETTAVAIHTRGYLDGVAGGAPVATGQCEWRNT